MYNAQLNAFLIVAKTRSFNKAAEEDVIRIATPLNGLTQALTDVCVAGCAKRYFFLSRKTDVKPLGA